MDELFKNYWKQHKALIKGGKSAKDRANISFKHGIEFGFETALAKVVQELKINPKITSDELIKKIRGN